MKKITHLEFKSLTAKNVSVAGDFNDWSGSSKNAFNPSIGRMTLQKNGLWIFPISGISAGHHQYKFIIDGEWESGSNRSFFLDEKGNLVDPSGGIVSATLESPNLIRVKFSNLVHLPKLSEALQFAIQPRGKILSRTVFEGRDGEGDVIDLNVANVDISENPKLEVNGLNPDKIITRPVLIDGIFTKAFISDKPLGPNVEGTPQKTVFRIFSPRAKKVVLHHFSNPEMTRKLHEIVGIKDADGVWEMSLPGVHWSTYYAFRVEGPMGEGEGFVSKKLWPDPYARAGVFHDGPSILIDPAWKGNGFNGWTDSGFKTPAKSDLVIWEASIRDLTSSSDSKVEQEFRGKYLGLTHTLGKGSGIDHMMELGINAVEFLPVFEFDDDPPGTYHWGYMTSLFFAPEAWYATKPLGNQINEFKALVNTLHENGIAVLLDVVYNHTGAPQIFMGMDKKYFYRHDGNLTLLNFSGCGNDFKSENPMARRMILDSLEYWVREFHIDGFRFDLAELIDHETLLEIEKRLIKQKSDIVLIAEPWSFRGNNKGRLKGSAWASWNDDFRNRVKEAAGGRGKASDLAQVLLGSTDLWTSSPWESVNYVESHDDFTLTDHLSARPDHNGSHHSPLEIRQNLFCAAAVLLSPGIPMLAQGQEMLRSKGGNHNSYNAGDSVNKVEYGLKKKNHAVFSFYKNLIKLRNSTFGGLIRGDSSFCRTSVHYSAHNESCLAILKQENANPKSQALILFNYDLKKEAKFHLKLATGQWIRVVGDQKVFLDKPLFAKEMIIGRSDADGTTIEIPPMSVEVWVSKQK